MLIGRYLGFASRSPLAGIFASDTLDTNNRPVISYAILSGLLPEMREPSVRGQLAGTVSDQGRVTGRTPTLMK